MIRITALTVALLLAGTGPAARAADTGALVTTQTLAPDVALKLARAAQQACRSKNLQVTVAVVERSGAPQVVLRDQLAGNFTYAIALRKARTAAGMRRATADLAQAMAQRPGLAALQGVDGILILGGGVPIEHNGAVIGAVGVSGAPSADEDHACAVSGIAAIADDVAL